MANLQFFDTLQSQKKPLAPLQPGKIKMYCCGVTPYGNTHIGHTRTFFSYDLLYRTLKDKNLEVEWARNITDIDDKIIKKAQEENVDFRTIVNRYVGEQNEVLKEFQLLVPNFEPKVTECVPEIIAMIQKLIEKGYAYNTSTGVYYRVHRFEGYGKLSKNRLEDLLNGARIEVDEEKEVSVDFVLWKAAKPGEPSWESPWGPGRPGWHIECSAMIHKNLGDSIDIHMGGRDLIFPHHEAEIAQSEGAIGKPLSSIWMHCGMMTLEGEKMSKSTNHYVAIADFLKKYPPEVLRLFFLSTHYTAPLDFSFSQADENLKKLARLYRFVETLDGLSTDASGSEYEVASEDSFGDLHTLVERMRVKMSDDLNSPGALAELFETLRDVNTKLSKVQKLGKCITPKDVHTLKTVWPDLKKWMCDTLGILTLTPSAFYDKVAEIKGEKIPNQKFILEKIEARNLARANKNWAQSDLIRKELSELGIELQDAPKSTKWTINI